MLMNPQQNQTAYIEIRGATGGDEAKLWGQDLLRMYSRFATKRNWKQIQIDDLTLKVSGPEVFDLLKTNQECTEYKESRRLKKRQDSHINSNSRLFA